MSVRRQVPAGRDVVGLTDPYLGTKPAARLYLAGHTFRWVRGDRFVAVQQGICVDGRRVLIIRDLHEGRAVREGYRPVVDTIAVNSDQWGSRRILRGYAENWLRSRP